jgi:OPT oligopeptide transporter protein
MKLIALVVSITLSLFSTIVMSYVSLATPIGPWIAPTLVFIVLLISKIFVQLTTSSMAYVVSAGSIGGIVATACAFSFPTIYFLDPTLFNEWMSSPMFFGSVLGSFAFLAGSFGLLVADISEKVLIDEQNLSFPIGQLIHKMISAHNQIRKAYELMIGFVGAAFFSFLQGTVFCVNALIPKVVTLLPSMQLFIFSLPRIVINVDIAPMIWAIGFVTGHVIALPLACGAWANIFILSPLQRLYFSYISSMEFTLAFCSGIVFFITVMSVIDMSKQIITGARNGVNKIVSAHNSIISFLYTRDIVFALCIAVGLVLFLSYFTFPWYVQLYLVVCSIITTYQIAAIAGRIGLALLGRFATFIMVPAMLIFNINYVHIVFIATFVEIAGGVAADVLFGRKLAQLSDISRATMRKYQLLGLVVASLSIGIIFWLFINHFGLGSAELFAYRAQSRQLLIQVKHFDYVVVFIGALFGLCLQQLRLNPMLVLGGLLMPLDITVGLVAGGLLAALSADKEQWYPFWSGIFASTSLCMLLRALI